MASICILNMYIIVLLLSLCVGSFYNIPAYDPSKHCSTSSVSAHTILPTSTVKPSHTHGSKYTGVAIAISISIGIAIILVIIILVIRERFMRLVQTHMLVSYGAINYIVHLST